MTRDKVTDKAVMALRVAINMYLEYLYAADDACVYLDIGKGDLRRFVAGIAGHRHDGELDEWPNDKWLTGQFERFLETLLPYPQMIRHDGGTWIVTGPEDDPRT